MARTVIDTNLQNRAARSELSYRDAPYWRMIDEGMHIGYRKGKLKSAWRARFLKSNGAYKKQSLGIADDIQDADGVAMLSFSQAQEKAREWFRQQVRIDHGLGPEDGYSVSDALDDYLVDYESRSGKSLSDIKGRIEAFIRPRLGDKQASELTTKAVRDWHGKLAKEKPRLRSKKFGSEINYRDTSDDSDADRKRRHSANKVLTILKAALNHAWREGNVDSDDAWRRVRPFKGVDAPRIRYLNTDESKRLINACGPAFRKLVQAALLTGCRYGEITNLLIHDFNSDVGTLHIQEAKSGRGRHVVLADEGKAFFKQVAAGRVGDEIMFVRSDTKKWGKSHQKRPLEEACKNAKILPAVSFHILRHTYASHLVMNGVPLQVVAQNLGHADTRMTEKHYAHLSPSFVAGAIQSGAMVLGIEKGNVEPIARQK